MASKTGLEFEGFNEAIARLTKMGANVQKIADDSLRATHKIVTRNATAAIAPHNRSGNTRKSLKRNAQIIWNGGVGSVDTGFNISHGGLPSIFLMYGTPRIKKDSKLYNAFYGAKTKREILETQERIFFDEIGRLL